MKAKWQGLRYKFTFNSASNLYFNFKHENLFNNEEYWTATLYNSNTDFLYPV